MNYIEKEQELLIAFDDDLTVLKTKEKWCNESKTKAFFELVGDHT